MFLLNRVRAWFHLTPPTTTTLQRGAECSMRFVLEASSITLLFRMGMDAGIFDNPNEEHPTEAAIITQRLFFMLGYIVTDNWLIRPALDWTRDEARKLLRSLMPQMEMPLSEIDIGIQVLRGTIPASNHFPAVTQAHVANLSLALNIPHHAALRIFREFAADSRGKWLLALKNGGFLTLTMGLPFLYGLTRLLGAIDTKDWKPCEIGALSMLCVAVVDGLVQAAADAALHDWSCTPACLQLRLLFEYGEEQIGCVDQNQSHASNNDISKIQVSIDSDPREQNASEPLLPKGEQLQSYQSLEAKKTDGNSPPSEHEKNDRALTLFANLEEENVAQGTVSDDEKEEEKASPQPSKPSSSLSNGGAQQMQIFAAHTPPPPARKDPPAGRTLSSSYQPDSFSHAPK